MKKKLKVCCPLKHFQTNTNWINCDQLTIWDHNEIEIEIDCINWEITKLTTLK